MRYRKGFRVFRWFVWLPISRDRFERETHSMFVAKGSDISPLESSVALSWPGVTISNAQGTVKYRTE